MQLANYVEGIAALIIAVAVIEATINTVKVFVVRRHSPEAKENVRLRLGRWLAVALEFELGADILRTAIAPSWTQIGQLAAIAALRTLLNYFLEKEIERAAAREQGSPTTGSVTNPNGANGNGSDGREQRNSAT